MRFHLTEREIISPFFCDSHHKSSRCGVISEVQSENVYTRFNIGLLLRTNIHLSADIFIFQ